MLSAVSFALALSLFGADDSLKPKADQCLVELSVPDMACPMGCSPVVTRALKGVKGVEKVRITFPDKIAKVVANKPICNRAGTNSMVKAVKAVGYQCEAVGKGKRAPES